MGDGVCFNEPIICNDGDNCTDDSCRNGVCVFTAIDCSDDNVCTEDKCDNGTCFNVPIFCSDEDDDLCSVHYCDEKMANVKKINLTVMIRMFVLWMFVIMEDVFTQFYLLVFSLLSRIHQLQQQL